MSNKPPNFIHISKAIDDEINYIQKRSTGEIKSLRTPWSSWNNLYMDGWEYGWIVTIAGASSMGKTTILNILETEFYRLNTWDKFETLSFNFEMLARRLVGRKMSHYTALTVKELYSAGGKALESNLINTLKTGFRDQFKDFPIFYYEHPRTPEQLLNIILHFIKTRKLKQQNKGLIITLDHVALANLAPGVSERLNIHNLMTVFNKVKKIYPKTLTILISQLNREIEKPERKSSYGKNAILNFPTRSDIYMADSIFQTSDVVIVPHRPEVLGLISYGPKKWPTRNMVYCHHLKNREGSPIITRLTPDLARNTFKDLGNA